MKNSYTNSSPLEHTTTQKIHGLGEKFGVNRLFHIKNHKYILICKTSSHSTINLTITVMSKCLRFENALWHQRHWKRKKKKKKQYSLTYSNGLLLIPEKCVTRLFALNYFSVLFFFSKVVYCCLRPHSSTYLYSLHSSR